MAKIIALLVVLIGFVGVRARRAPSCRRQVRLMRPSTRAARLERNHLATGLGRRRFPRHTIVLVGSCPHSEVRQMSFRGRGEATILQAKAFPRSIEPGGLQERVPRMVNRSCVRTRSDFVERCLHGTASGSLENARTGTPRPRARALRKDTIFAGKEKSGRPQKDRPLVSRHRTPPWNDAAHRFVE